MKRLMTSLLGLALFAAPAVAALAQTAAAPAQDAATQEAVAQETTAQETTAHSMQDDKAKADPSDRYCLRHTGSHIRRHADKDGTCIGANGRSYTREELQRTGRVDLADALRTLDVSVY